MVYGPFSLLFLAVFMAVNLILLPFAYLKTALHKFLLAIRFNSSSYLKNLGIYIVMGIPFLLCAQFSDVYRFMVHTYDTKPRQQTEQNYLKTIRLADFDKFLTLVIELINDEGLMEMKANEFIQSLKK